jgi:predicted nucleic acid-binding Zn ribbon protein
MSYKKGPNYRNQEAIKLDDALEQMFETFNLKNKADQTSIINMWEELMGKTIASRTGKIFFKENVLYVQLTSAPLKQELVLSKDKIIKLLREQVGEKAIRDIVFR